MTSLRAKLAGGLCVCAAICQIAPAAQASVSYQPVNEITAIGVSEGNNKGEFLPRGLSVDPVTHDVFVGGMVFEGRIHKWDATTEVETVFGREEFWGYFGTVVDPNNHDLYALNSETQRMEKYFPSGKKGTPTYFQTDANGVPSLGPEGHFFIPKSPGRFNFNKIPGGEGEIREYSHGGELLDTIDCSACPGVPSFNGPVTTALNQEGDLFVADSENERVVKFENVGGELVSPSVFSTGPSSAVAVDRSTGRVFVGGREGEEDEYEVTVYDSLGNELGSFGAGMFQDNFEIYGGGDQITVDQGTGHVYVDDLARFVPQGGGCCESLEARVWEFAELLPPGVETEEATVEASRHVTLNASVDPNGNLALSCTFEYGATESYGQSVPCSPDPGFGDDPVSVHAEISGLQPNSDYHYRVVVTNEGGTSEGDDVEFTTLIDKPVVTTGVAGDLSSTAATLNGSVNPLSNPVTSCHFEYGPDESYGSIAPCSSDPGSGSSPVAESTAITGLSPSSTYHYRLVAGNDGGVETGADATFTTLPPTPSVTTGAAINVLPDGAKLLGKVNAQGSVTSYHFEYGPTTSYGQSAPAGSVVGEVDEGVSAVVTGLLPDTAYHYRLVATNAGGTTFGDDQALTTLVRPIGHAAIPGRAQVKSGKALIPLTCKGSVLAQCSGTLTLRARIKKGIRFILVKVGAADYEFLGQRTEVVAVKLNKNGRKVLSQYGRKAIPAIASAGGANRELRLFVKGGNSSRAGHRGKRHHG
jgi:hypothetical protein